MDRVRFGRALGFGARQAMKTLVTAVDAATAENPSAAKSPPNQTAQTSGSSPATGAASFNSSTRTAPSATNRASQARSQTRQVKQRLGRGSRRFGESVWEPFTRLSGVLWLEVTGVFFGLFALLALGHLWKLRAAWHANAADTTSRHSMIGAAIMFVLFGYFCVSSFVRARRRERKR